MIDFSEKTRRTIVSRIWYDSDFHSDYHFESHLFGNGLYDATKGTHTAIGFIPQQIREIIPEAVDVGEGKLPNGDQIEDFHYLNKMYIYTLNVCATQELHRIITRQQAVIDSLISRIENLESL